MDSVPWESDRRRLEADQELVDFAEETHLKGYPHHMLVEEGRVWDVLASVSARENIDLLLLGTHGRGGLKKLILGSVAEEVLRLSACPTLTVGPHAPTPPSDEAGFRKILYVADFGPASNAALPHALSIAVDYRAKLILLHVMQPVSVLDVGQGAFGPVDYVAADLTEWRTKVEEEHVRKLKNLVPAGVKFDVPPECVVRRDFLSDGILRVAEVYSVEMIVMGVARVHSPRLAAHMPGNLTHEVICRAKCPVLTVRN
jgi:nucleotide-binding universal stress UspA family protein